MHTVIQVNYMRLSFLDETISRSEYIQGIQAFRWENFHPHRFSVIKKHALGQNPPLREIVGIGAFNQQDTKQ